MPQKRAKQSVRRAQRAQLGYDLAPSTAKKRSRPEEWGDAPRGAMELLTGVRPERTATEAAPHKTGDASALRIRPGERMRDFNQRVERTLAPGINATMRRDLRSESNSKKRERRREIQREKKRAKDPVAARCAEEALGWQKAASARPLHDVAQSPPAITQRPKPPKPRAEGAVAAQAERPKPSLARQRILDEERERIIALYRARKKDGR
ncbi:hypothetical protein MSPP1_001777 [Malassezia sp. CBS 17886]|nr:hypothetical protein MSPP1_001777 [Malassezia sp. CBS 17886]